MSRTQTYNRADQILEKIWAPSIWNIEIDVGTIISVPFIEEHQQLSAEAFLYRLMVVIELLQGRREADEFPTSDVARKLVHINVDNVDNFGDSLRVSVDDITVLSVEGGDARLFFMGWYDYSESDLLHDISVSAGIRRRWEERVIQNEWHLLGAEGAKRYLSRYGRNIHYPKLVALAKHATQEIHSYTSPAVIEMAEEFWKEALRAHRLHVIKFAVAAQGDEVAQRQPMSNDDARAYFENLVEELLLCEGRNEADFDSNEFNDNNYLSEETLERLRNIDSNDNHDSYDNHNAEPDSVDMAEALQTLRRLSSSIKIRKTTKIL